MGDGTDPAIVAVAAVAENGVIGDGPTLPWDLPTEVRRYRERVADATVAIGRRTFDMYEDPPGAYRIVLSRSDRESADSNVEYVTGVEAAIQVARERDAETLYVLGGASIYEAFLPSCDRLLLSRVEGSYAGDTTFPAIDTSRWSIREETVYEEYTLEEWHPDDR